MTDYLLIEPGTIGRIVLEDSGESLLLEGVDLVNGIPGLTFQVAFASRPGDDPLVWTTVGGTNHVGYQRGEPNEYGTAETGESTVVVGDGNSWLDPKNAASPYYPNVKRMKAMRAFLTVNGVTYPLFQHFLEREPRTASVAGVWTERTLTGVDGFAWFALAGLKGKSYAGELSSTRWGHVLDDIGWPASRRTLDAGSSSLDPIAFADNDDTKALAHLLDVIASENGFGFIDAAGNARFRARHSTITNTTVVATFADGRSIDTGAYPTAIPYVDLQPESTDVVNDYSGSRAGTGMAVMTASDSTSIGEYGPVSQELTFLIDSDAEVQDALDWRLAQTKEPDERIDAITVMPGLTLARWVAVLGLEVGDRIRVVEWPPGFTAPVVAEYLIRHLSVELPLDLGASTFTFQLTPASTESWFLFDSATRGFDNGRFPY